jgi:hypothetical protein
LPGGEGRVGGWRRGPVAPQIDFEIGEWKHWRGTRQLLWVPWIVHWPG